MSRWISRNDWEKICTAFHNKSGQILEEKLQILGNLEEVTASIGVPPLSDPLNFLSPPGPVAVWFGENDNIPFLLVWHKQSKPQYGIFYLPTVPVSFDEFQWHSLNLLKGLSPNLFRQVNWIDYKHTEHKNYTLAVKTSEREIQLYYSETEKDTVELSNMLKELGFSEDLTVRKAANVSSPNQEER